VCGWEIGVYENGVAGAALSEYMDGEEWDSVVGEGDRSVSVALVECRAALDDFLVPEQPTGIFEGWEV
jgi:hypothetical protein